MTKVVKRSCRNRSALIAVMFASLALSGDAFVPFETRNGRSSRIRADAKGDLAHEEIDGASASRRRLLGSLILTRGSLSTAGVPWPARAKVEGYAPPTKALSEEYRQGTAALADMDEDAPLPKEAYKKLPSGLVYADLRTGSGQQAADVGSKANVQWVLRKSNGYFVDSSEVSGGVPFIFTVGDGTAIAGLDEGVRGMRAGGVRRLLIPVGMGYVEGLEDGKPGPLPAGFGPRQQMRRVQSVRKDVPGEYIFLEIQLTRVR